MPAYRIETERLVLRCFSPEDAPKLKEAIDASLDHLLEWLPWAKHEPESLDAEVERLRRYRADFDLDRDWVYGIFARDESVVLGGTGLHPRVGPDALEIGYWIRADRVGQGLATEAVAAIVKVAFEVHNVGHLEIHCDPTNVRSAAIARRLGFTHDATLRRRALRPDGSVRDTMIWSLFASETAANVSSVKLTAFDATCRPIVR